MQYRGGEIRRCGGGWTGLIGNQIQNMLKLHRWWLTLLASGLILWSPQASGDPAFDTSTPVSFFTNVASRLLSAQFNLDLGHLQVYPTNQYTPAVHRILQVTANILDAENTNFYPSVFKPLFTIDAASNVCICGYQQITNVSGPADAQLATPHDVSTLFNYAGSTPLTDANGPVNVYGVPWVIGAKQGLPSFNQLALLGAVQITRPLELTRSSLAPSTATYTTNQEYIVGITNDVGLTFWNSYNSAYPRPVTVCASDTLFTTLTNEANTWTEASFFSTNVTVFSWPGARWGTPPSPTAPSFLAFDWGAVFQNPTVYDFDTGQFDSGGGFSPLQQLPQFGLSLTNYLQAFILDGSNVIDYVQFCSPNLNGGLNQALADPNYPDGPDSVYLQWSTNAFRGAIPPNLPYGALNQLYVSGRPPKPYGPTAVAQMPAGGMWIAAPTPMGAVTPDAEAAYYNGFFSPEFQYNGLTYVNQQLSMLAPYTPVRTVYVASLLQANDPLVHYLSSDMNAQAGSIAIWNGSLPFYNGFWSHSDGQTQPLPAPPVSPVGGRYQPWGNTGQMAALGATVDANVYNVAYRDPLVWSSDDWNFPTGQAWNLNWIGQVHRGTPWQTIFLKSTNILQLGSVPSGMYTWAAWTGDSQTNALRQFADAFASAPANDWQMVGLLAAMLNTNDLRTQISVNDADPNAWEIELDGIIALTNAVAVLDGSPPELAPIIISSNSVQAATLAAAIQATRAGLPGQSFPSIGAILATPQLSVQSPFLNLSLTKVNGTRVSFLGINDQAYEAISSQLLSRLRMDAIGQIVSTNGQVQVQFTGYDGHSYALEASPDLLNWTSVSTNFPVNGRFEVVLPALGNGGALFYRSALVQ